MLSRAFAASPALGFSNLIVRLEDDEVGLASGDYRTHILEALRAAGLNAVGAENLVFNQDESDSADYEQNVVAPTLTRSLWLRR